jgi:hypothetical protein
MQELDCGGRTGPLVATREAGTPNTTSLRYLSEALCAP